MEKPINLENAQNKLLSIYGTREGMLPFHSGATDLPAKLSIRPLQSVILAGIEPARLSALRMPRYQILRLAGAGRLVGRSLARSQGRPC